MEEPKDAPPAGEDLEDKAVGGAIPDSIGFQPGAKSPGGGARSGRGRPGPPGGPATSRPTCVGGAGATGPGTAGAVAAVGEGGATTDAGVDAGGAGAEDFLAKPFRPHSDATDCLVLQRDSAALRPVLAAESC